MAHTGTSAVNAARDLGPDAVVLDMMLPDIDGLEVLRRAGASRADDDAARLRLADLELDEDSHEVWRGGSEIQLTPTEFKLLRYLLVNARRVVSKAQILDHVWAYDFGGDASVVETYISYLRKKVDRSGPPLIHTVRGFGYALRPPPEPGR
jgi:two-component system OmpR family response regulator